MRGRRRDRGPTRHWLTLAVALVAFLLPVAATPQASASPPMGLRVDGARLLDRVGRPVQLRGVNVSGTEFACVQGGTPKRRGWSIYGGQPLDDPTTFRAIARWGANVVRVPLNEHCWLGINGVASEFGGSAYRRAVQAEVEAIHAAGLYAVLDLHWNAPGDYAAYSQQPMADAEHAPAFWRSVSRTFRDDPGLLFDLYNEPYGYWTAPGSPDAWACWLKGCDVTQLVTAGQVGPDGATTPFTIDITWRTAGMQSLVDAVRSTGARQPLVVNGADWANDVSGWEAHRPRDPLGQLVAGWHSYPGQPCGRQACWDDVVAPLAQRVPVLVGETGDSSAGPQTYVPWFLDWADRHGLHYLAWTWNPWQEADNVLVSDWRGAPTTGLGRSYRNHLLGGTPPPALSAMTPTPAAEPSPAGVRESPPATVSASSAPGPRRIPTGALVLAAGVAVTVAWLAIWRSALRRSRKAMAWPVRHTQVEALPGPEAHGVQGTGHKARDQRQDGFC